MASPPQVEVNPFRRDRDSLRIRDDRGLRVPLGHLWMREVRAAEPDEREKQALTELERRLRSVSRESRGCVAGMFAVLGIGLLLLMAPRLIAGHVPGGWPMFLAMLLSSLAMLPFAWLIWKGNFGYHPKAVRRVFLESRRCPSCVATLERAEVEEDGCRVCPSCRAAWRC